MKQRARRVAIISLVVAAMSTGIFAGWQRFSQTEVILLMGLETLVFVGGLAVAVTIMGKERANDD